MESGEEGTTGYDLFPFRLEDVFIVEELKTRLRRLPQHQNVSPATIRDIGTVLFAIERLPRSTPGVAVAIGPIYSFNNESSYCDLYISESEFRLRSGGSTYDPGVGSDSFSCTVFELETSGFREGSGDSEEVLGWLAQFDELVSLGARIHIEHLGDDSLVDWSAEGSHSPWDELADQE